MTQERRLDRRGFLARGLAAASAALLGGCEDLSDQKWVKSVLNSAKSLTRVTQEALLSPQALAREFGEADISRDFRANGSTDPDDPSYVAHAKNGFADWKLVVGGLVEKPLELSLVELRAMPSRTQITRHDCVEGWSCIGKWKGLRLNAQPIKPSTTTVPMPTPPARPAVMWRRSSTRLLLGSSLRRMIYLTNRAKLVVPRTMRFPPLRLLYMQTCGCRHR